MATEVTETQEQSHTTDNAQSQTVGKEPASEGQGFVSRKSVIVIAIIVSAVSSITSVAAYDHFFAQKVVAVDIKTFLEEKKADYVAGRLDDAGLKREMDKLEVTVASIPKNKAVLMGDLVVKNVDIIKP